MKVQFIPMRVHLVLDVAGGAALALLPQLTGARRQGRRYWLPYVAFGALEAGLAVLTKTGPPDARDTRVAKLVKTAQRAKETAVKGVAKVR